MIRVLNLTGTTEGLFIGNLVVERVCDSRSLDLLNQAVWTFTCLKKEHSLISTLCLQEDWLWFAFHPFSGFQFKEVEPGIYEHWIHRNEHWPLFQGIFHTFPAKQSINIKDLYVKHPTKPNLWAFKGRMDDLVVLSNGYKIKPLDTEAFITTHPAIDGCLVVSELLQILSKLLAKMTQQLKQQCPTDRNRKAPSRPAR